MKKTVKTVLSILLSALILLSVIPVGALTDTREDDTESDIQTSTHATADNPLAAAIADAMNDYSETNGECLYGISDAELDGMTVTATVSSPGKTSIIAAVYDEDTMEMVTSGTAECDENTVIADITLAPCTLPQYFLLKVFLVNENLEPVSECFTERKYTREMQEFYSITVNDFDPEHIAYYHNDSNFAAVSEDAIVIYSDELNNTLVLSDYAKAEYTFSSPNEELMSLKKGELMYLPLSDDIIIGTVEEIRENEDSTVTVICKKDEDPLELFDYIHVDTSDMSAAAPMSRTSLPDITSDEDDEIDKQKKFDLKDNLEFSFSYPNNPKFIELPSDWENKGVENNSLKVNKGNTNGLKEKIEFAFKGKLDFETSLEYCYHKKALEKDVHYFDIDMKIIFTSSVTIEIGVAASFSFNLVDFTVPTEVPGLALFVRATVSIGFSAKVSATGTLTITYYNNYSYENLKKINRPAPPAEMKLSIDEELSINITADLKIATGIDIAFGVVKADLYAKLTATADVKPYTLCMDNKKIGAALFNKDWTAYYDDELPRAEHDCRICLNIPVKITLSVGLELDWSLIEKLSEQKARLDKVASVKTDISKDLLDKVLRASLVNDSWEFAWTDKDEKTCPHMRFLVKFTVTNAFTTAPESYAPFTITYDEEKSKNIYKGESPVEDKIIYTDENGVASCYLPSAVYDFEEGNEIYKILSSDPSSKEFRVTDDSVRCTISVNKAIYQYIYVKIKQTNKYAKYATVTYNEKEYNTQSSGYIFTYIFPYEDAEFRVKTNDGYIRNFSIYIDPKSEPPILIVDLGTLINVTVVNKYNEPLQGVTFQTLSNIKKTTNTNGKISYYELGTTIYATVFIGDVRHNITESVKSDNMDLTIQLPVGHMVQCTVKTENGDPAAEVNVGTYGKTDINGKAIIFLDTGDYTITVNNSDGTSVSKDISVQNNSLVLNLFLKSHIEWDFNEETGTLTISGRGKVPTWDVDSDTQKKVKHIVVNEGITRIGASAFYYYRNLLTVQLPENLISIGSKAFRECVSLENINIPSTVTTIGSWAFLKCEKLEHIYLPDNLESIGDGAFTDCDSLTSVIIPRKIKSIGFADCDNLKTVYLPNGLERIYSFAGCVNLETINIPETVTYIGDNAFFSTPAWENADKATTGLYIDNCLIKVFDSYPKRGTFTVKEGTRLIAEGAFKNCNYITEVVNMDSVRHIGRFAFWRSSIVQIEIPEGVTRLEEGVLHGTSLKQVVLPSTLEYVYRKGTVPLDWDVIANKSTIVYFRGTEEQWNNIENIETLKPKTVNFNYTGSLSPLPKEEPTTTSLFSFNASAAEINGDAYTVNDTIIGHEYIIYAVKDENAENLLSPENLLFIDQQKATDGALSFCITPKDSENDFTVMLTHANILEVKPPEPDFTPGDVDEDGTISSADARMALRASVGLEDLNEIQEKAADVDTDGTISSADARLILRASVGLEQLPDGKPHIHSFSSSVTKEPTCTEDGEKTFTCSCGKDSYKEKIPASHFYEIEETVSPTCTSEGYTVFSCSVCGDTYESEKTPATGHTPEIIEGKAASCKETGLTNGSICSVCNEILEEQTVIPTTGHNYTGNIYLAPTCTQPGHNAYRECENCDFTEYEEIPALGHELIYHEGKPASCSEAGWNAYETCSRCDYSTKEYIPVTEHALIKHEGKEPTYTEPGYYPYESCLRCDYSTYSEIPALTNIMYGHTLSGSSVSATQHLYCTGCCYGTKAIPSFNNTANILKKRELIMNLSVIYKATEITDLKVSASGSEFYKDNLEHLVLDNYFWKQSENEGWRMDEYNQILTDENFFSYNSSYVSYLQDEDIKVITTEAVSGIDFLDSLPDSVSKDSITISLSEYKAFTADDLVKITAQLDTDTVSTEELPLSSYPTDRILGKNYMADLRNELFAIQEDFSRDSNFTMINTCLQLLGTPSSYVQASVTPTVTYYYSMVTKKPVAAVYNIQTDILFNVQSKNNTEQYVQLSHIYNATETYYCFFEVIEEIRAPGS